MSAPPPPEWAASLIDLAEALEALEKVKVAYATGPGKATLAERIRHAVRTLEEYSKRTPELATAVSLAKQQADDLRARLEPAEAQVKTLSASLAKERAEVARLAGLLTDSNLAVDQWRKRHSAAEGYLSAARNEAATSKSAAGRIEESRTALYNGIVGLLSYARDAQKNVEGKDLEGVRLKLAEIAKKCESLTGMK